MLSSVLAIVKPLRRAWQALRGWWWARDRIAMLQAEVAGYHQLAHELEQRVAELEAAMDGCLEGRCMPGYQRCRAARGGGLEKAQAAGEYR